MRSFIFSFFFSISYNNTDVTEYNFTNTKHTTTLAAAAAAVVIEENWGNSAGLEVASSALAILLYQRLPSSILARKKLPFGLPFWDDFAAFAV